ncbi:class I SAM-dependent methyltransferase [Jatrophihabitans sp. YIM 134969]
MTRRQRVATGAVLALTRPIELADRLAGRRERLRMRPAPTYDAVDAEAVALAHDLAGGPDDDGCRLDLDTVRASTFRRLDGSHHHDGGTALADLLWVLVRHTRPDVVVETGVARGITSAFVLDALHRNGHGRLVSIDLPPIDPDWLGQTGAAVDPDLAGRWTYVRGAARRKLPRVLADVGRVDLFVHDGLHTSANTRFELEQVWPRLRPGGFLVVDDADDNDAVRRFGATSGVEPVLVREVGKDDVLAVFRRP